MLCNGHTCRAFEWYGRLLWRKSNIIAWWKDKRLSLQWFKYIHQALLYNKCIDINKCSETNMCKVYNQIVSLTTIKSHLQEHNVKEYKSVSELINFQKSYSVVRQQISANHKLLIEQEKSNLIDKIIQLDNSTKAEKTIVEKQLLL